MTARKTGTTKKTPSRKKAPSKKKASGAKKAASAKKAPAEKKAPSAKTAPAEKKASAGKKSVTGADVQLGHVFALRPRVPTSFRQEDFRRARRLLEEEAYASAEAAARAVVEKALELNREGAPGKRTGRGKARR